MHFSGFAYVTVLVKPLTLEGYNFFVLTPIHEFFDSLGSPLSLESIHI